MLDELKELTLRQMSRIASVTGCGQRAVNVEVSRWRTSSGDDEPFEYKCWIDLPKGGIRGEGDTPAAAALQLRTAADVYLRGFYDGRESAAVTSKEQTADA